MGALTNSADLAKQVACADFEFVSTIYSRSLYKMIII